MCDLGLRVSSRRDRAPQVHPQGLAQPAGSQKPAAFPPHTPLRTAWAQSRAPDLRPQNQNTDSKRSDETQKSIYSDSFIGPEKGGDIIKVTQQSQGYCLIKPQFPQG